MFFCDSTKVFCVFDANCCSFFGCLRYKEGCTVRVCSIFKMVPNKIFFAFALLFFFLSLPVMFCVVSLEDECLGSFSVNKEKPLRVVVEGPMGLKRLRSTYFCFLKINFIVAGSSGCIVLSFNDFTI